LSHFQIDYEDTRHIVYLINSAIPYLLSIIVAAIILIDLLKNKIKGIPVVLVALFSIPVGMIFFLFLINNKIKNNDR
jgi:heme/copper-type cytochrome/quinol oxidase subunit 4